MLSVVTIVVLMCTAVSICCSSEVAVLDPDIHLLLVVPGMINELEIDNVKYNENIISLSHFFVSFSPQESLLNINKRLTS